MKQQIKNTKFVIMFETEWDKKSQFNDCKFYYKFYSLLKETADINKNKLH